MIFSKLSSNVFKLSKESLILNQRSIFDQNCLFYSNSILKKFNYFETKLDNRKNEGQNYNKNQINKLVQRNGQNVFSNSLSLNRRFLSLNNNRNATTKLPILYQDQPKSLSTRSSDSRLEFKKIDTQGNLNLIQTLTPIETILPKAYVSYIELLRLNKFTGTIFLLYPCLWAISLGGVHGEPPDVYLMGRFIIGAILMRSAGCIVNDLMDKNIDKKVERTKLRPLAAGKLNEFEAIAALAACLTGSLHVLLSFDPLTIMYGASSLLLVGLYPMMKRLTNWPQLFLGLTFNSGVILGWSVIHKGLIDWSVVLPLYTAGIFWTLIYDTIYAYQDYYYDKKLGLKSTTIIFNDNPKIWLHSFAICMTSSFLLTGYLSNALWPFYLGTGLSAAHIHFIIRNLKHNDPNNCLKQFKYCQLIGYYILIGAILSVLFDDKNKPPKKEIDTDNINSITDSIETGLI